MLANPDIGVTEIAHRLGVSPRRSIDTSPPHEPRILRMIENNNTPKLQGRIVRDA